MKKIFSSFLSLKQPVSLRGVLHVVTWVALVPCLAAWVAPLYWFFDLWTSFRVQYAVFFAIVAVAYAVARSWKFFALTAAMALVNAAYVLPVYFGAPVRSGTEPPLRLLSVNVHTPNRNYRAVMDLIRRESPDVVLLMEINDVWAAELAPLNDLYPQHVWKPSSDNFGIALFCRPPIRSLRLLGASGTDVPMVYTELERWGRLVRVIGVHPLPPVGGAYSDRRNEQLDVVGATAAATTDFTVVIGDLNCTPWSPVFSRLLEVGHLQDTRRGFGNLATWPVGLFGLRIPLDHVLLPDGLAASRREVLEDIGSDHFPIVADIIPAPGR